MKQFALMGAAGYIAPRHLKAIKETGNNLVAAVDPFDSVGLMDSFFPECSFFKEFELFDRHLSRLKSDGCGVDFLSVCSPDYMHDAHIRYGLKLGANVISEKPLVLNPWNLDALEKAESESGKKVFTILQMRYHQSIIDLKNLVESGPKDKIYEMDLTYITSRGNWFFTSWKGDVNRSGGIATNIGIHFYDMLYWIFGEVKKSVVNVKSHDRVAGYIEFERARVRYFLSINADTLPAEILAKGQRIYRSFNLEGREIEFTDGFADLHTESYKNILRGEGFGIKEARKSIQIVYDIRNAIPVGLKGDYHPFASKKLAPHPFGWQV
ncbi:MAG: oxidoreductase [Bacteroidetes bacterium GWF2_41_61]|nr:MAG: oxidoreductase [Bacteroidetes bacterium GWE2_40_15]OFY27724.1 MAG: oxidoreductase [Bacteroidetes bacterium GWF2_41_61]OFY89082.1 MAG: oxidoreductase [Bacteroidetes bacterium RIFOXYA12_FULL_40_10]HBG23824.1 oxidoreductase [Rikenellaceae bacterium]HBZ26784.1 oxidoreductase [Rikenellaceae bacterium]